jgi:regulatory protein
MNNLSYEQALNRIATYCSRAERCVFDVRRKLETWEIPINQQNEIIKKLQKEKFLDEERFCKAFVNDKTKYNRWGIYKIRFELKKRLIPEELIKEALKNIDTKENSELLRSLIEQKMKTVKGKNEWEIKQKLMRFVAGRGFALNDIERILEAIPFHIK